VKLDAVTGKEMWEFTRPGATTLTGELPQAVGGSQDLLAVVSTNLGYEVQRLDPASGRPLWKEPLLLLDLRLDARAWACKDGVLFRAGAGDRLSAHSLADGGRLWEQPLPRRHGRWRVRHLGGAIWVSPIEGPALQIQFRWLTASLQWKLFRPPRGALELVMPVFAYDPATGRPLQQLGFVSGPPFVESRRTATADIRLMPRLRIALAWEPVPLVSQDTAAGLALAFGGHCWGLLSREPDRLPGD
jgi:outer membrane protein assembly factor BamB